MPQGLWKTVTRIAHQSRNESQDSEARYRELFEHVADGVYETSADGRILAANRALVRMLGFDSLEELTQAARAFQFYVDPTQRESCLRQLEAEGRLQNAELELVRRDGRRITVLENARAVRDFNGKTLYYQGTLTDITERKQTERELVAARDRALDASRLKSQFLANMSHELRTPLNAIVGMSSLLVESPLNSQQREYVETVLHSARFLMEIIGELLDFSRIESGQLDLDRGVFRLREIVEEAVVMLSARAAAKEIQLICDIDPKIPELLCGDAARLQQVLTNLIGNAVKFTEQGEVIVRAMPASDRPEHIRFEVTDTGIGISPEARKFIFDPFRQADGSTTRKFGGTGLGLAIVRQIVEHMGGVVDVTSHSGSGSTFWFEVTLETAPGCRPSQPFHSSRLAGKRVLLVEPNSTARDVLDKWLRRWGLTVIDHAGSTADFDVCVVSADQQGFAACGQMLRSPCTDPEKPCILLSPVGQSAVCREKASLRAKLCLTKPIRELALLEALLKQTGKTSSQACPNAEASASILSLSEHVGVTHKKARILAAEDNKVNQKVIAKLIERLGYQVDVVNDGHEVLEAVQRQNYGLVLMDCQMPRMDGFEATAAIRRLAPPLNRIPVIAVTANAVQGDRETCLVAGMDDYLSKPIVLEDLADILDRWAPAAPVSTRTPAAYPAIE